MLSDDLHRLAVGGAGRVSNRCFATGAFGRAPPVVNAYASDEVSNRCFATGAFGQEGHDAERSTSGF